MIMMKKERMKNMKKIFKVLSIFLCALLFVNSFLPIFPILAKVQTWFVLPMSIFIIIYVFSYKIQKGKILTMFLGIIYVFLAIQGFIVDPIVGMFCLIFAATLFFLKFEYMHPLNYTSTAIVFLWSLIRNVDGMLAVQRVYTSGYINYIRYFEGTLNYIGYMIVAIISSILVVLVCRLSKNIDFEKVNTVRYNENDKMQENTQIAHNDHDVSYPPSIKQELLEEETVLKQSCEIKFCRKCGFELIEGSEFCSNCGTIVVKE